MPLVLLHKVFLVDLFCHSRVTLLLKHLSKLLEETFFLPAMVYYGINPIRDCLFANLLILDGFAETVKLAELDILITIHVHAV